MGTLRKLYEMGYLSQVDVISTVSGGSIVGAYYCLNVGQKPYPQIEQEMIGILSQKSVIRYILCSGRFLWVALLLLLLLGSSIFLLFTPYKWLAPIPVLVLLFLIVRFQFRLLPVSKIIERAYDAFFYHGAPLGKLPAEKPELVINSTNIQTSRLFTFSRKKMGDSSYPDVVFKPENFPLSRAVMASSCVPFAFTPVGIASEFYENPTQAIVANPVLVDGGVYDNQGIHKLTPRQGGCQTVLVSDAGNKLPFQDAYNNVFVLLIRTMDVFMARIKHFQMMAHVYNNAQTAKREIAYWSLGWDIENCIGGFVTNLENGNILPHVVQAHAIPAEWLAKVSGYRSEIKEHLRIRTDYDNLPQIVEEDRKVARSVGTNLTKLSRRQIDCLMNHAAILTELQIKLYCP